MRTYSLILLSSILALSTYLISLTVPGINIPKVNDAEAGLYLIDEFVQDTDLKLENENITANSADADEKQKNIKIVEDFLAKAYDEKDPEGAVAKYLSKDFMSSLQLDEEQAAKNIANVHKVFPDLVRTSEPAVSDEDGDFVVVFSKWSSNGGDGETADLYKVVDGKIIEHHQAYDFSNQLVKTMQEKNIQNQMNMNSTQSR